MEPDLDPTKTDVIQDLEGVEVIFLGYDFGNALDESKSNNLKEAFNDMQARLPSLIPKADLNLNFSYFPDSASVLRINAPLSIGIEELYGDKRPVAHVLQALNGTAQGNFLELASGPNVIGFILVHGLIPKSEAMSSILNWGQTAGLPVPSESFSPLIAYTAGWQAVQVYMDALAALKPKGAFVLFSKDFPQLDKSVLPENIKFIAFKGMPHKVMKAIIQESPLSPLITGDISLGQALSTLTEEKTVAYEAPEWKLDNSEGIQKKLAQDLKVEPGEISPLFLNVEKLMKLNREELRVQGVNLARVMGNSDLQKRIFESLQERFKKWDLIGNTLDIADGILNNNEASLNKNLGYDDINSTDSILREYYKRLSKAPQEQKITVRKIIKYKVLDFFEDCKLSLTGLFSGIGSP
jgi:hypothetical protein